MNQADVRLNLLNSLTPAMRRLIGFSSVAVGLLTACAPPGQRAVLEGRDLMDRGDYNQAIESFRLATRLMPTNAVVFNYLGLALHQTGQPGEAERAYLRALSLNHDLTEVHYNLGCLWLLQSNRLDQARSELTTYTLRMPNIVDGWLRLGEVQLRCRDSAAAEKSLGEALRLDPRNAYALNALGLARLNRKRPNEAVQFFAKAAKEQPGYAPALLNLAIVAQQELNDPQLAIQKYREYISTKPTPEDAPAVKAIINKLEQDSASVALARSTATNVAIQSPVHNNVVKAPATELAVSNTPPRQPLTNLGQLAATTKAEPQTSVPKPPVPATTNPAKAGLSTTTTAAGHVEVVKLTAEPVIRPADDTPAAPQPAAMQPAEFASDATTGSQSAAADAKPAKRGFLQKINPINLFTRDGKSPGSTGPTYAAVSEKPSSQGQPRTAPPAEDAVTPSPATRTFPRYSYRSPDKPVAGDRIAAERPFSDGVAQHQARHLSEAIQSYKRATQLDPAYYDAQYNLALAAADSGNLPLALASYENSLAIQPDSLDARYNFGLALRQGGYVTDAVIQFEKILAKYPNDSRTHLALGNLYAQQLQDNARAREHYLAVLAIAPQSPQAGAIRYWLSDHPK